MHRDPTEEELRVNVRLMNEPCLWCWEIRDATGDAGVKSSWTAEWKAFDSAEEAYTDGCRQLDRSAA